MRSSPSLARPLAALVALMGLASIASALLVHEIDRLKLLHTLLPLALTHASRSLALIAGCGLLVVARALWRGKRVAWGITLVLLVTSAILHLTKGLDWEEAGVALALAAALTAQRASFTRRSDPITLRRLPALIAGGLLLILAYGLAGFAWLAPHVAGFSWSLALQELVARFAWSDGPLALITAGHVGWFLQSISLLSLTLASAVLLLLLRPVFARSLPAGDRQRAAALIRRFGTSSIAPFANDPDKLLFFGERAEGVVAYRLAGGVAVVCGDPIAAPSEVGALAAEFAAFCARQDWQVCFYEVQPRHLPDYAPLGMQAVKLGEDAWVELPAFTLKGPAMADIRHAVSKAGRDGLRFHLLDPAADSALWRQVRQIEQGWRAAREGVELGFSIGRTPLAPDPQARYTLALAADGQTVVAFCSFLPLPAASGWALDAMRRGPGAPNGTMEFVIARALEHFRDAGEAWVTLGMAPLASVGDPGQSRLDAAIRSLADNPWANQLYGYRSLLFFKQKFNPTWRGGYLLYPGALALPQVLRAVLQVHIPSLGPRLLLRALREATIARR